MDGFARTPQPPYYAVIFTSRRTVGDDGYGAAADRMVELAAMQPGYLGVDTYDVLSLAEGKFHLEPEGTLERDLTGIAFSEPSLEAMPTTVTELQEAVTAALR